MSTPTPFDLLDLRVTALEYLLKQQMYPRIQAMDRAISLIQDSTETTHTEIQEWYSMLDGVRGGISSLQHSVDQQTSEFRRDPYTLEAAIRSDIQPFREEVDRRFKESDGHMDLRSRALDQRLDRMDTKLDEVLAAVLAGKNGE